MKSLMADALSTRYPRRTFKVHEARYIAGVGLRNVAFKLELSDAEYRVASCIRDNLYDFYSCMTVVHISREIGKSKSAVYAALRQLIDKMVVESVSNNKPGILMHTPGEQWVDCTVDEFDVRESLLYSRFNTYVEDVGICPFGEDHVR